MGYPQVGVGSRPTRSGTQPRSGVLEKNGMTPRVRERPVRETPGGFIAGGAALEVADHETLTVVIDVPAVEEADGAGATLMISENLQATRWVPYGDIASYAGPADGWEWEVGMVWWPGSVPATEPEAFRRINVGTDEFQDSISPEMNLARPSSSHSGGVMVTYCDGHQEFLADDIEYEVFQQMMAPDDVKAAGQDGRATDSDARPRKSSGNSGTGSTSPTRRKLKAAPPAAAPSASAR